MLLETLNGDKAFKLDSSYQIPLSQFTTPQTGAIKDNYLDLEFNLPSRFQIGVNRSLYFDIEMGNDFLSQSDIEMTLYQVDSAMHIIGESKLVMKDSSTNNDPTLIKRVKAQQKDIGSPKDKKQKFVVRFTLSGKMLEIARDLKK